MDIDRYSFKEFKEIAASFHGYPAPGLLIGGYMVARAKKELPEDTLFDAIVETDKCLPDAVQLLTLCSTGNGWMKRVNLGRYALCLYDKYTGKGVRVFLDPEKLSHWPELRSWFFKLKPKKEQDSEQLFNEIREAGDSICTLREVNVHKSYLTVRKSGEITTCPICKEAYPQSHGGICKGCQGDAPYDSGESFNQQPDLATIDIHEGAGRELLHDMTCIIPGKSKGPAFRAGQTLLSKDLCRLQQMGNYTMYALEKESLRKGWVHENDAAMGFAGAMSGKGVKHTRSPKEGKITFYAEQDGLLKIDLAKLERFNLIPDIICAARQNYTLLKKDLPFAGTRAIPLFIPEKTHLTGVGLFNDGPLFSVLPLRKARVGVLVTGTEIFKGLIKDSFLSVITGKVEALGSCVNGHEIVPDDQKEISAGVKRLLKSGADLIVTTAGLSVDPGDVTLQGLRDAGLEDMVHGMPVLPGAMTLTGRIGNARVIGVPACALHFKRTSLDFLLPRVLAGVEITKKETAAMGEGGFCLNCKACTFPKCPFGK